MNYEVLFNKDNYTLIYKFKNLERNELEITEDFLSPQNVNIAKGKVLYF